MPAADSRWPMLVFTEPIRSGWVRPASLAVDGGCRLHLDRIPQRGSRSMGFQIIHVSGRYTRSRKRLSDHASLRWPVRDRRSRARPVLVDRRAANHSPDPVTVGFRLVKPLEDDHPAALAPHGPIRRGVEGPAPALRREHPQLDHLPGQPEREDGIHRLRPAPGPLHSGAGPLRRGARRPMTPHS